MVEKEMIEKPTKVDILFGRDSDSWNHEGNRNFRALVVKHQEKYHTTQSRSDKVLIVANIVSELKASGAKFLKRDNDSKMWFEVDRKACIEKVGHAIRDKQVIAQRRLQKRQSLLLSREDFFLSPPFGGGSSLIELTTHGAMHLQNSVVQDVLAAQRVLAGKRREEIIANDLVNAESLVVASLQERKVAQQLKAIQDRRGFLASFLSAQRRQSLTSTTNFDPLHQVRRKLSPTNQFPMLTTPTSSLLDAVLRMPITQSTSSIPLQRVIDDIGMKSIASSYLQCYK